MIEDGPAVVPLWRAIFSFSDKKVKGYELHPSVYIDAHKLWIDA